MIRVYSNTDSDNGYILNLGLYCGCRTDKLLSDCLTLRYSIAF